MGFFNRSRTRQEQAEAREYGRRFAETFFYETTVLSKSPTAYSRLLSLALNMRPDWSVTERGEIYCLGVPLGPLIDRMYPDRSWGRCYVFQLMINENSSARDLLHTVLQIDIGRTAGREGLSENHRDKLVRYACEGIEIFETTLTERSLDAAIRDLSRSLT